MHFQHHKRKSRPSVQNVSEKRMRLSKDFPNFTSLLIMSPPFLRAKQPSQLREIFLHDIEIAQEERSVSRHNELRGAKGKQDNRLSILVASVPLDFCQPIATIFAQDWTGRNNWLLHHQTHSSSPPESKLNKMID